MASNDSSKYCAIVPGYREAGRIGKTVEGIKSFCENVIVVDDGSDDDMATEAKYAGAVVLQHEVNRGKGVALETGFEYAGNNGFEVAVTMDADGQHAPEDLRGFLDEYERNGTPVLVGNRMANPGSMPFVRRMTNRYMSWLLSRRMGQHVPDTQCGYRLYRLDVIPEMKESAGRFAAESLILLYLAAAGVRIGAVPIKVIYGDEKSKINPVSDTLRFFSMLREYDRGRTTR